MILSASRHRTERVVLYANDSAASRRMRNAVTEGHVPVHQSELRNATIAVAPDPRHRNVHLRGRVPTHDPIPPFLCRVSYASSSAVPLHQLKCQFSLLITTSIDCYVTFYIFVDQGVRLVRQRTNSKARREQPRTSATPQNGLGWGRPGCKRTGYR